VLYSRLTHRFLVGIVAIVAAIVIAFYIYSVPLIKSTVFGIERNASHIALNNVFELADKMQAGTQEYQAQVLSSNRNRLRAIVDTATFFFQEQLTLLTQTGTDPASAQQQILNQIKKLTYGEDDYLWVANSDYQLISHPDPAFQGKDTRNMLDEHGNAIMPSIIEAVMKEGEGFYKYRWSRLYDDKLIEKFSYVKYFPQWSLIFGSGVYIDDIEAEVKNRREAALEELRQAFSEIKIAETGYLFIFNEKGKMLVHPNNNIDGVDFRTLKNPVTNRDIMRDLINVADTGKELFYKWDRPSDPGNYRYEKVSLVRFLPGFNWYICSSVYLDELQASSILLADRIFTIALIALIAASLLAIVFVYHITRPLRHLSETAHRISNGELNVTTDIHRTDEIGVLARAFDRMVDQLGQNIKELDHQVNQRTSQLSKRNRQLSIAMQQVQDATHDLQLMEERQRLILDTLPAQIAYIDEHQRYVFVNQGYADAFNLSKDDIIDRFLWEVIGQEMYQEIRPSVQSALKGSINSFEYTMQLQGHTRITKRTLIPFCPASQFGSATVHGMINLSIDITAEREAEQRLQIAQRMNTVGQLAGGLAHDFNNLLTIVQGNLQSIEHNPSTPASLMSNIQPAIRAIKRGTNITSRLLSFARKQPLIAKAVNLPLLMEDFVSLMKGSLPSDISLALSLSIPLNTPWCDSGQLEDALVNLVLNARDAMKKGGAITVIAKNRTVTTGLYFDEAVNPGNYVEVSIKDEGTGFSDLVIARAFDPFFTTQQTTNSSGLGLSMVYGFVKQSNGYIALANHIDGAFVSILLPVINVPPEQNVRNQVTTCDQGGLALLVDDEDDVRSVIREQLIQLGYSVIESSSADEAINLLGSIPDIRLVVSDVVMPGKHDGYALEQTAQRLPNCRIVLMSGFPQRHRNEAMEHHVLQKPFSQNALLVAIEQAVKPI